MQHNGRRSDAISAGAEWQPGGKPKGARNRTTLAIEALIDGAAADIANKAIELAKAGDSALIRALLDRAAPPRRDRISRLSFRRWKRRPMR